jgi:hypothetical protein
VNRIATVLVSRRHNLDNGDVLAAAVANHDTMGAASIVDALEFRVSSATTSGMGRPVTCSAMATNSAGSNPPLSASAMAEIHR